MFKQVRLHDAILKFYQRSQPIAFSNAETLYDDLVLLRDQILMYGDLSEAQTSYLNEFIGKFDTNLTRSIRDIFEKWINDNFLTDLLREVINEEVIVARDGEYKLNLRLIRDKQDSEAKINLLKEKDNQFSAQLGEKAKQIDLEAERKRIDNIVGLPPTVDNAETTDIRIGSDGVTYDSAGSAVRSQLDINNLNISKVDVEWIKGFYVNDVGVLTPYAPVDNVGYTKIFIPNGTTSIITNAVSGLAGNFGYYDRDNNPLKIENKNAHGFIKIGLPENTHYVMLTNIFAGPGLINISPYVIFNNINHTAFYNVINEINKINDNISEVGEHKLKGKKLSVLADSISTYAGMMPTGQPSQYPNGDVTSFDKTWMGKLLNKTGMELDTLNAWAGSRVTDTGPLIDTSRFVNSARWSNLGNPDVIIVYGGTNDLFQASPPQIGSIPDYTIESVDSFDLTKVASAYLYLLMKLKETYPNAKVYCCGVTDFTRDISSPYWKNANGLSKQQLVDIIRECCDITGATFIDLLKSGINYYTYSTYAYDGDLHPNALGMEYIASYIHSKL